MHQPQNSITGVAAIIIYARVSCLRSIEPESAASNEMFEGLPAVAARRVPLLMKYFERMEQK